MDPLSKILKRFILIFWHVSFAEAVNDFIVRVKIRIGLGKKNDRFYIVKEGYRFPICLRYDTSDQAVFDDVFNHKEYGPIYTVPTAQLIIDCGANAGYTSTTLLTRYPAAKVIAIEPDRDNFEMCKRNLGYFGARVTLINAAVWSKNTTLTFAKGNTRKSRLSLEEGSGDERELVRSTTLDEIIGGSGFDQVDILKVDIEGAEAEIFKAENCAWMSKVKNIAIEIHGPECEQVFKQALKAYDYTLTHNGPDTFCLNISPKQGIQVPGGEFK